MMTKKRSAEKTVREIRRATRRHYSAEEKIRIVLEGLRGEDSIAGPGCTQLLADYNKALAYWGSTQLKLATFRVSPLPSYLASLG